MVRGILILIFVLWMIGLGIAYMLQHKDQYLTWTKKILSLVWRNGWQFIIGILTGHFFF